jgi:hypothetical protein
MSPKVMKKKKTKGVTRLTPADTPADTPSDSGLMNSLRSTSSRLSISSPPSSVAFKSTSPLLLASSPTFSLADCREINQALEAVGKSPEEFAAAVVAFFLSAEEKEVVPIVDLSEGVTVIHDLSVDDEFEPMDDTVRGVVSMEDLLINYSDLPEITFLFAMTNKSFYYDMCASEPEQMCRWAVFGSVYWRMGHEKGHEKHEGSLYKQMNKYVALCCTFAPLKYLAFPTKTLNFQLKNESTNIMTHYANVLIE